MANDLDQVPHLHCHHNAALNGGIGQILEFELVSQAIQKAQYIDSTTLREI